MSNLRYYAVPRNGGSVIEFAKGDSDHKMRNFDHCDQNPGFSFKPDTGMTFSGGYSKSQHYTFYMQNDGSRLELHQMKMQGLFDNQAVDMSPMNGNIGSSEIIKNSSTGNSARPISGHKYLYPNQ